MKESFSRLAAGILVSAALVMGAQSRAAIIVPGLYDLGNHPDTSIDPPPYGLRLDELVNVTPGFDFFTFDFNHPQSNMTLLYNDVADTITISGTAFGGRDVGNDWANDQYRGVYTINFLYNVGVQSAPGDDDILVMQPGGTNFGTITLPAGPPVIVLSDVGMGGFTFRLGDEDNDLGHRGFPGISGWGWLSVNGVHTDLQDWIFTATFIPEPLTPALAGAWVALLVLRRR